MKHYLNILYFALSICLITSCAKKEVIYYQFGGITVTRINSGNKVFLYYGKHGINNLPDSYIIAEHSGLNSGMQAYLTFRADQLVEIHRVMDSFKIVGNEKNLILLNLRNEQFNPWLDKIRSNYNNTIEISNNVTIEQKRNIDNKSQVTALY